MQGTEERRLRRMNNTPQGGVIEGNAADEALMEIRGDFINLTWIYFVDNIHYTSHQNLVILRIIHIVQAYSDTLNNKVKRRK